MLELARSAGNLADTGRVIACAPPGGRVWLRADATVPEFRDLPDRVMQTTPGIPTVGPDLASGPGRLRNPPRVQPANGCAQNSTCSANFLAACRISPFTPPNRMALPFWSYIFLG
jgi:hypothetical protein